VRIRIALATAVAVIVTPVVLFALFSSTPAASARVTRHEAVSQHRAVKIKFKLMSYAEAQRVAKTATFYNAVTAYQAATFYADLAFFKAVAAQQQQEAAAQAAALATAQAAAQATAATAATAAARTPAVAAPAAASPSVPAAAPGGAPSDATTTSTPDWACIRQHESGGNYGAGGGGAYQFQDGTWTGVTGLPGPAQSYPAATQDAAALTLYAQRGWAPWTTRYACGL
jgi:hypothetical protein